MTKPLNPRALLIVAALFAACGEGGPDEYDDQTGDPSQMGTWDAGNAGGADAQVGGSDTGLPWATGSDAGNGGGAADASGAFDAGVIDDAGWSGGSDASAEAGSSEAGAADASTDGGLGEGGVADASADGAACTLTYANFGQQFLTTYCISCHGARSPRLGVRLDSLAGITARKVQARAAVLNSIMPQGNNLPSQADRERFAQWLDCGPN